MQQRASVAQACSAGGARGAILTTPIGALVDTDLQVHLQRRSCFLNIKERAAGAQAFAAFIARVSARFLVNFITLKN